MIGVIQCHLWVKKGSLQNTVCTVCIHLSSTLRERPGNIHPNSQIRVERPGLGGDRRTLLCKCGVFFFFHFCHFIVVAVQLPSCVWLFETPLTVACQAPLSLGFSRQVYWSGLPFPFPGDLPKPGIELRSSALQEDSLQSEPPGLILYD